MFEINTGTRNLYLKHVIFYQPTEISVHNECGFLARVKGGRLYAGCIRISQHVWVGLLDPRVQQKPRIDLMRGLGELNQCAIKWGVIAKAAIGRVANFFAWKRRLLQ